MRHRSGLVLLGLFLSASAGLAHVGVTNDAVLARMDNMKDSAKAVETLGEMAKGARPFDARAAAAARDALVALSVEMPALFEARETDPKMEARPELWDRWDDFLQESASYQAAARNLDISSLDALRSTLPTLGRTCSSCHKLYRVEK